MSHRGAHVLACVVSIYILGLNASHLYYGEVRTVGTGEAKACGLTQVQGQCSLHGEFQTNQVNLVRPCLKRSKINFKIKKKKHTRKVSRV